MIRSNHKRKCLRQKLGVLIMIPIYKFIGGSSGCAQCTPPSTGPNSFIFTHIFGEKCLCGGSMPPMGNPGSPTEIDLVFWVKVHPRQARDTNSFIFTITRCVLVRAYLQQAASHQGLLLDPARNSLLKRFDSQLACAA